MALRESDPGVALILAAFREHWWLVDDLADIVVEYFDERPYWMARERELMLANCDMRGVRLRGEDSAEFMKAHIRCCERRHREHLATLELARLFGMLAGICVGAVCAAAGSRRHD